MRRTTRAIGAVSAVMAAGCFQATASNERQFVSDAARESYAMGVLVGQQLGQDVPELEVSTFLKGMQVSLEGGDVQLSQDQVVEAVAAFERRQMATAQQRFQERVEKNTVEGAAFREEFSRQDDVVTLASGVQYQVIEGGAGSQPGPDADVVVHYSGRLIDGTEFDSSYARNEPARFPVARVIPGWTEVLQEMKVGSRWKVVVPPEMAYGERGSAPLIEPNATLVFEIELIEIS